MAAPTICTVTGTLRQVSGASIAGVTIRANSPRPFIHPTDNSLVVNYEVTTTTASDGTWSLGLIETTTPGTYLTLSFVFSMGTSDPTDRHEYTIQVPNTSSATFQSLIGTQV